jgi:ubiquinone/menaquinone biosynthesis C-methylase UbiE
MALAQKEQSTQPDLKINTSYDAPIGLATIAGIYTELVENKEATPFNQYVYDTSLTLMDHLSLPQDFTHLDLACGSGKFLRRLETDFRPRPRRLMGFDSSRSMVDIAREKFPDLDIRLGEIQNILPGYQEIADSITCINGVHYLSSIEKVKAAYTTAFRLLKPGGHYLVCTGDEQSSAAWRGMTAKDWQHRIHHGRQPLSWSMPDADGSMIFRLRFYPYTNAEHFHALKQAGFSSVEMFRKIPPRAEMQSYNPEAYETLTTEPVFIFYVAGKDQ